MYVYERGDSRWRSYSDKPKDEPEINFVSAILLRAAQDCAMVGSNLEDREAKIDAYQWIVGRNKWFGKWCAMVDVDPEMLRSRILEKSGARCEAMIQGLALKRLEKQARKDRLIAKAEAWAAKLAARAEKLAA